MKERAAAKRKDPLMKNEKLDDMEKMIGADAYDYLEIAESAGTKKKSLEYVEMALALEPNNADALMMKADLTAKNKIEFLEKLDKIIDIAAASLIKARLFDKCREDFWGLLETRPYMRARSRRIELYIDLGMMKLAEKECEEMLGLCDSDNLGIRYTLMHIYALFEEEDKALRLLEKYSDDGTQLLLPLSIIYFKKRDFENARKYLELLKKRNKGLKDFIRATKNEEYMNDILYNMSPYGYSPDSVEELIIELQEYEFLFIESVSYFPWLDKELKKKKTDAK